MLVNYVNQKIILRSKVMFYSGKIRKNVPVHTAA